MISGRHLFPALVCAVVALAGCRDAGTALGASPAEARANTDALFFALGARFGPIEMAPGYEAIRAKSGRSALVPSALYRDTAVWTTISGDLRELEVAGRPRGSSYLLGTRGAAGPPHEPGEYRRVTRLRGLGEDQYEWAVRDELSVGTVSPDELGRLLQTVLRAAERSDEQGVRAAYRRGVPGATNALGRLFTLDSVEFAPAPGGGTRVSLAATVHPAKIAGDLPRFSRFVQRYTRTSSFDLVVEDEGGTRWWTATLDRQRLTIDLRVHGGTLAPLEGAVRRMPDRLIVRGDLATRLRVFEIAASRLVGDVVLTRKPDEKAFTVRFRSEPDWHLPPLVQRFVSTALRRPFEGDGALFALSVQSADGRTILARDYRMAVQESGIVRWFGGLGNSTVSEFRTGGARAEYQRFNGQLFTALRRDAVDLLR